MDFLAGTGARQNFAPAISGFSAMSQSRSTFFRQSGWMVLATVVSGACMFGVHPFSKKIPESEYGIFGTMLAVLNCMAIPTLGLRMIFVQQTAAALSDE